MDLTVEGVIRAMTLVGSNLPAFKALLDQVMGLFDPADQSTLRAAYEDARKDNDEGHRRLQEKLAEASRR